MVKNLPANAGDTGLILGLGRSPGGGNGKTHSSIPVGKIPWTEELVVIVHGITKSQTQLSD